MFVYCVFSNYLLVFLCLFFVAFALSSLFVMVNVMFFAHCCYVTHYFPCCLSSPLSIILTLVLIITILLVVGVGAHSCLATKLSNSTTFTCHLVAYLSSPYYSSYFPHFYGDGTSPPPTFNVQVTCSCSIMEFARLIIFAF